MEQNNMSEANAGRFVSSLVRNNSKIKRDRAEAIGEDAEVVFKRTVEDIAIEIRKKERERDNMLDMSPTNAMSLMVANDFDAASFVSKDLGLGVEIRNLKIKLEIASSRYDELFKGDVPALAPLAPIAPPSNGEG
jgi:hypothetical protein